ncbi:hypothetical protein FOMG_09515 [Fusarium oxysporum f. sp. melonis 26406]|uniref:Uncharacterized protein n=1 Tax=Fusarium oxysporum f. sp. melonis 26406 TaxID=1089452 RepID=X0A6X1_FUSOX|nr:hypothetical protein FOMG_09515 [Fusarium oxysporum f. sp. melonis 26406]
MAAQETDVDMNEWHCAKGNTVLSTSGLCTCIRVAIVGEYPTGCDGPDRFLVHISESEEGNEAATAMSNAVSKAMEDHGFKITKAALVSPDTSSEDDEYFSEWVQGVIDSFKKLTDGEVEVEDHDTNEIWGLEINSEKEIFYGPE